jgi:uncharacterized protein (TIGR00288 family)
MDSSYDNLRNIALLIDADNTQPKAIDAVLTVMAELGQVNIRRAYGNFAKNNLAKWDTITNKYGIRPHQQFDVSKGKNATDMAMTIDAIDLLYQGKVDGFGIMSSDADFTPLVTRVRQEGIVVYGFGESKAPDAFKNACTRFIDIDKLMKAADTADDQPPSASAAANVEADTEFLELISAAYKEAKKDEKGYARVQQIGQIAGNRSSFDARNYGFKSLSELFRSLGNFKVESRDGGQMWVRRLR